MNEELYRILFNDAPDAMAIHRIIHDEDENPVDYQFLNANNEFEKLIGLKKEHFLDKRITEVNFEITERDFDWISFYSEIALSGKNKTLQHYQERFKKWYKVYAFSPDEFHIITVFSDITPEKDAEILLTSLNDFIFELDENYVFKTIIAFDEDKLFKSKDHALGKSIGDILPAELANKLILALNKARLSKNKEFVDYPSPKTDENKWFRAEIQFIEDEARRRYIVKAIDITEYKHKEKELHLSELRIDQLLANSFDITVVLDASGVQKYVSASVVNMLGFTPEELTNICVIDTMIHPDDRSKALDAFTRVLAGESVSVEYRHRHKNGRWVWLEGRANNQLENPALCGIVLNVRDITERKRTEKTQKEWHDLMQYIIRHDPNAIAVFDMDLKYKYVSQRLLNAYNIKEQDIIGKDHYDLFPETPQKWKNIHKRALSGEIISLDDDFFVLQDGTIENANWECRPWYYANGSIGGTILYIELITERKKAEKALHDSYETQKAIISASPLAIISISPDGHVLTWNESAEKMFGWSQNEVIGKFLPIVSEDKKNEFAELRKYVLDGNSFYDLECTRLKKDGSLIEISISTAPIRNHEGKIISIMSVVADITERKQVELALLKAKIIAEESNRIKSEFIANMSHELRTPLNSIIGFSQILMNKIVGDLNEKQIKYTSNILYSGNHLLNLINDILDISKIESGNMKFEPEKMDLKETIDETLMLIEPLANKKQINFKTKIEFDNMVIYADKVKMKQIMYNLLSNAIKFTPENGSVCVYSKIVDSKVLVSVSDKGIGISSEKQKEIFQPFKQVHSSNNRAYEGTGLGLSIVKYYVEMHSGEIQVESEVGKGSTFTFTIPIDLKDNR